ncbi:MAG: NAD-dependent epimerase/dehydratase family protein [Crocinitomicaceae bacterium]
MKILITGGAGFVGSSIAIRLKKENPLNEIICFDNLKRRGSELNMKNFLELGIKFIHGDIRNVEDFKNIGDYNVMIEASAEPSVLAGTKGGPNSVIQNNLIGSINCFNNALNNDALLIFLSTSRVYPIQKIENANFIEEEMSYSFSDKQTEFGISEYGISEKLSLIGSRSFYGTTKLCSEQLLEEYHSFYGLKTITTRFGVIAGPRQMGKTDQGVVTLWMANHFWKKSLSYIGYGGKGKQFRDILHIDDLVDLVILQIEQSDKFNGKVFNAGGGIGNSVSLREMTNICQQITGNKIDLSEIPENRPADLKGYVTDNSSIFENCSWRPNRNVEKTFADIYEWIKTNQIELKNILN